MDYLVRQIGFLSSLFAMMSYPLSREDIDKNMPSLYLGTCKKSSNPGQKQSRLNNYIYQSVL